MYVYFGILVRDDQKEEYRLCKRHVIKFKYAKPFSHHYLYREAVDNHNHMCQDGGT